MMVNLFPFQRKEDAAEARKVFADGMQFVDLKQHHAAIKEFQIALKSNPKPELEFDALHQIGICYFELEKYKDALSFFDKAIKNAFSGEKKGQSYYYKGIALLKKNKHDAKTFSAAFECFYKAAELNGEVESVYMKGCMESAMGEAKEAQQSFHQVLETEPEFENFFANSGSTP